MIVAFISTDIIIVNKYSRMYDLKKILSMTWYSLDEIEKLGKTKK